MKTPMLAKTYDGQDPTGWLVSEKLDGVRAVWSGGQLNSRNGNAFPAPKWFLDSLPAGIVLDGELWIGRGRFQDAVGTVRGAGSDWSAVRYLVFDAPEVCGGFEARLGAAERALTGNAVASVVKQVVCNGKTHLQDLLIAAVEIGGEGVMLRAPGSPYEHKRSAHLLKLKPVDTHEAKVIGYQSGTGKYTGLIGALVCVWGGINFEIGTGLTERDRMNPPEPGSVVTFSHNGVTDSGVPRFPVFVSARNYE